MTRAGPARALGTGAWRAYRSLLLGLTLPVLLRRLLRTNAARAQPFPARRIAALAAATLRNTRRIETASSPFEHLAIADALLSVPDGVAGDVVECGSYKGGSTANLSLACALVGRELHVYDSFAGLPEPRADDRAHHLLAPELVHTYDRGLFAGSIDEVRANVQRFGALASCRFHAGFFEDTMAAFDRKAVVLAFLDVDLLESFRVCVRAIWPRLVDGGFLFVHEAQHREVAAFFFDGTWWQRELGSQAPGLVGAGSGLGLDPGDGYWESSLAFTRKNVPEAAFRVQSGFRTAARGARAPEEAASE